MAKQLNRKLVFVVGSLAILVTAGILLVVVLRLKYDAERHVRSGDQFYAAGDFVKAADAYGRAVDKKRTNLEYLQKLDDATLKIRSTTEADASERYSLHLKALESLARTDRGNADRWRAYLAALVERAEAISSVSAWKAISDTTDELARLAPPGTPTQALAKVYGGYAGLRRLESLDDAERAAIAAKLQEAAADPGLNAKERDIAYGTLARLSVIELARVRSGGTASRIDAAVKACDAALADSQKNSPEGVQTAIALFERAILDAKGNASDPALLERIDALRAAVESNKLDGMDTMTVAGVLSRGGRDGVKAAIDILGAYSAKDPTALMQRRAHALLVRPTDRQAALAEIDAALKIERPTTGIVSASYEGNRLSCALIRFDILHDLASEAAAADREAALVRAKSARDEVAKLLQGAADQSALLRADAKLEMSRGDFQQAAIKLNEVFRKGSSIDLELYVLAALCSQQLGETGRALELVSSGLQLTPSNPQLLKLRAQLEVRTGRAQAALATLREVRAIDPTDTEAQEAEKRIAEMIALDPGSAAGVVASGAFAESFGRIQGTVDAGNYDAARQQLAALKAAIKEPDVRVERLGVVIEMQAGDNAKALQVAKDALARFPGDAALIRLQAVLSSEDPVDRVIAMTDSDSLDEKTRPVIIYLRLMQSEQAVRNMAEREKRLGNANAESSQKAADRLAQGLAEWRQKAEAADRLHPILLEADFRAAMTKKDYAGAATVVKLAKESSRDASQGPLLEAQLLEEQGKSREAIEVLERAVQSGVDTSNVYRMLGTMTERQGNLEGAVRQYEESYKRKPDDMQTVRFLVGATVRAGNLQRALEVLRNARQVSGLDEEIASVWLSLESQIGDRRTAMALRENQYRATPGDTTNAVALASMLATAAPERVDVVTEGGEPAYSEAAWQALNDAGRNNAIDKTRAQWRKRAEDIFAGAMKRNPSSIEVAEPYANLMRALGRDADAEKVLADAVSAGGTAAGWRGLVALGNLQLQFGKREAAEKTFADAIAREDAKTRDATRTIIETLVAQERYPAALPYLESLAKQDPDPVVQFRYAEALMRVGRVTEARAVFTAAAAIDPKRDYAEELLDGVLSIALGDELRGQGKATEARAAYEAALAPLQRAKALSPAVAQPFMQDALAKRKLFELTGERARLQEALAAADKAVSLGVSFFPACAVRSDVLLASGDVNGALNEYDRFLRLIPTSLDARKRAVELAIVSGDLVRAEALLRAAIGYAPGEPSWHFALGDVLGRRGRFVDAAAAFSRADTLRPDAASFLRELDARVRGKDFRGVTEAARRRGDFVRSNPTARAFTGVALIAAGETGDGVKTLTESYQAATKAAEGGDEQFLSEWYLAMELLYGPPELSKADELLQKVIGADLNARARTYLASMAIRGGSGGPQKALAYLQPVESADYSKQTQLGATVFDLLGTANYLAGDCPKAVTSYEKAVAYAPDSHSVLNNYAYLCGKCQKDPKKGLPAARRAVQLNPGRSEYLDTLGALLTMDGQHREALEILDRAATTAKSAAIQFHRAQALFGLNRNEDARAACEQAVKLNPDPPTLQEIQDLQQKLK